MNPEIASRLGNNELIRWVSPYQPLLATLVTLLRSYSLYHIQRLKLKKKNMILTQFPFDAHFQISKKEEATGVKLNYR